MHSKMTIIPNFINEMQANRLVKAIDLKLKRIMPLYEEGHFDRVIRGYRECTISMWDPAVSIEDNNYSEDDIFARSLIKYMQSRIKDLVPKESFESHSFIAPHILDLRDGKSGIDAHIDYLHASGGVIAGLTLLSPAVMKFEFKARYDEGSYSVLPSDSKSFKVLIPPNSLYIQRDELRYEFTHAIPMSESLDHSIDNIFIPRHRRIALILRDKKKMKSL
jgi:hypothetical protein